MSCAVRWAISRRCRCIGALLALFVFSPFSWASSAFNYQLKPREIARGVYVIEGVNADFSRENGCNIINTGFIVTSAGVLVVNTGPSKRYGEAQRAAIARITSQPIVRVVHLNLHPDYFLGNQAFSNVPRAATAKTRAGIAAEHKSYEDNLFRLCGDWMLGTETVQPDADLAPGLLRIGDREFELLEFHGHTASDLVLIDRVSGVVFAGGLVFSERIPTTPHAQLLPWLAATRSLAARIGEPTWVVPSHGPVHQGAASARATERYLDWLDQRMKNAAASGAEMQDVMRLPLPLEFRRWAAADTEYPRNIVNLYPVYEKAHFGASRAQK